MPSYHKERKLKYLMSTLYQIIFTVLGQKSYKKKKKEEEK